MTDIARLEAQLEKAYATLNALEPVAKTAEANAEAHTINDPGALSGIRRKPNRRADDARYNSYARAAEAQTKLTRARDDVTRLIRAVDAAKAEAERRIFTAEDLAGATVVKDKSGYWYKVVRVNKTTVSIDTGYSWVDRIPLKQIVAFSAVTK